MSLRKVELLLLGFEIGLELSEMLEEDVVYRMVLFAASRYKYEISDFSREVAKKHDIDFGNELLDCLGFWEEQNEFCDVCPSNIRCLSLTTSCLIDSSVSSAYEIFPMEDPFENLRDSPEAPEIAETQPVQGIEKETLTLVKKSEDSSDSLSSNIEGIVQKIVEENTLLIPKYNKHAVSFSLNGSVYLKLKHVKSYKFTVRFPLLDCSPTESMKEFFRTGGKYWVSRDYNPEVFLRILEEYDHITGMSLLKEGKSPESDVKQNLQEIPDIRIVEESRRTFAYSQDDYPLLIIHKFEVGKFHVSFCRFPNAFDAQKTRTLIPSKHGYDYKGKSYRRTLDVIERFLELSGISK